MKLAETRIKVNKLLDLIEHYPNKIDKQILSAGFLHGFKVGYEGPLDFCPSKQERLSPW
jgi:hypothetical protein